MGSGDTDIHVHGRAEILDLIDLTPVADQIQLPGLILPKELTEYGVSSSRVELHPLSVLPLSEKRFPEQKSAYK